MGEALKEGDFSADRMCELVERGYWDYMKQKPAPGGTQYYDSCVPCRTAVGEVSVSSPSQGTPTPVTQED